MKNFFEIVGGNQLNGTVRVQTAKNAVLPILSASLLCSGSVHLKNCPDISDFHNMIKILIKMGVEVCCNGKDYILNSAKATSESIDAELAKTMRSSVFLIGSTLARFKRTVFVQAGGCNIGKRPIDLHIKAFKALGVEISEKNNQLIFDASNAKAGSIKLKIPSVGATENIVQFASLLKGKTVICNPAKEPEVVDLCNFLNCMGAKIKGAGTNKITIYGVNKLKSTHYQPISDRVVAATILSAVAVCGGNVTLTNVNAEHNKNFIKKLVRIGCQIKIKSDIMQVYSSKSLQAIGKVSTGFYPKFPTDLQSLMLVIACLAKGKTCIVENIFENRLLLADELLKMGANIRKVSSKRVEVVGVDKLTCADVEAKDLRGGAALIVAALATKGKTTIQNSGFVLRGYENLPKILQELGANIKLI